MTGFVFDQDLIDLLENAEALERPLDSKEPGHAAVAQRGQKNRFVRYHCDQSGR
jgi:hypothetical protein